MLQKIFIVFTFFLFCTTMLMGNNKEYFNEAGKYYAINPVLLLAIAQTESSQNPQAINCANKNGSCDYGIMQINSIHLPMLKNHGISQENLFDARTNIFIGAWVLKGCMNKHGISYDALNCYNGKIKNNNYYIKVLKNYSNFAQNSNL